MQPIASFVQGFLGTAPEEPVLELADIQGGSIVGFNKDFQRLVLLRIVDVAATRRWLGTLLPYVANAHEVLMFNRLYKETRARRHRLEGRFTSTWLSIAVTASGLRKLTSAGETGMFIDRAFFDGLAARSPKLGDPVDPRSPGCAVNWIYGGPGNEVDLLLIFAGDQEERVLRDVANALASCRNACDLVHVDIGTAPPAPLSANEHFGFRDGISQPGVRGRVAYSDFLTPRRNPGNPSQGMPGQWLVWPGEFVFGYPRQNPNDLVAAGEIADGGPLWTRNGTFLVLRRYRQDVAAFDQFILEASLETGLPPDMVASKVMGRWRSGTPIVRAPGGDIPAMGSDDCANNNFLYRGVAPPVDEPGGCHDAYPAAIPDPTGAICPFAAHLRRAYPRDDADHLAVQTHRILRRGLPFGPIHPGEGERGLLFVGYVTSIERQFEFLLTEWMNNPNANGLPGGHDMIVGQSASPNRARQFRIDVPDGAGNSREVLLTTTREWVTPTAGGYFFVPSLSGLRYLSDREV